MKQNMNMTDRHSEGVAREKQGSNYTVGILNEYGKSMGRVWLQYASEVRRRCHGDLRSWEHGMLRYVLMMVVMMVVGVSEVKADDLPFTVTTDESNPNYYLIQSFAWPSFYAVPYSIPASGSSSYTSTTNVPSENTLWYFMNSGTDGYYYIIHYSGNYLYHANDNDAGIHIKAKFSDSATDAEKNKYLFSFEATGDNYFIHPKAGDYVNKAGGSGNYARGLKKSTSSDGNSQWIFVEFTSSGLSWTAPFTLSEGDSKSFYKIKNAKNPTYFISQNTGTVNTTSTTSDDMVWYFEEVPVSTATPSFDGSDSYITYYYIRHRETDKYMCFNGSDAVSLQDKTDANEQSCQFIVVKSARAGATYSIMPKQLKSNIWNNNSVGLKNTTNGTAVYIRSDRADGDNNTAHWLFEYVVQTSTDENRYPYLIQSMQCSFYNMIPNVFTDESETVKNVSTLNVPCSTMLWYFKNAGITSNTQYYYITDANGWYLKHNGNDNVISITQEKDDTDNYKFTIETNANGGFNLMPKGATKPINKSYDNSNPVKLSGNKNDASSRWDLIPYKGMEALPQWTDSPFNESTDDNTYYYKIASLSQPTKPIILNSSGQIQSVTIPEGLDERKTLWVIKKVEPFDADSNPSGDDNDLLDFYTFQNVYTGELLYYKGGGRDYSKAVLQMGQPEGADLTWSHFVIVQTINGYNIIPRAILDNTKDATSKAAYNCLNRRGGTDVLGTYFDSGDGSRWTFSQVAFCMPPVFEESNGNITISCATNGAEIHYQTTDDSDPTGSSTLYNNGSWPSSTQVRVKAIAVVKDGETVTASSAVVTLLNKPDITLEAGPYIYKGEAWEPSLTVSIGETGSETTASSDTYTATYANNVNAGTATVTLSDADPTDTWYIWNGSTTFPITPKVITITAASETRGYNGTPLTNNSYTCDPSLATGDSFTSVTVTGSQTNVGSSANVPSAAVIKNGSDEVMTGNYDITYENGTLTVTVRSIGNGINPAEGITVTIGAGNTIILKDGEITLIQGTDYTVGDPFTSGKYSTRTVEGTNKDTPETANYNYSGSFTVRNAIVTFQNDDNGGAEYSATFVAEPAGADNDPPVAADNAKGHALPTGITAYIITSIVGNYANAVALNYIPEGIPVLLLSNAGYNGFFVQDASGHTPITSDQISSNMLEETAASTHFDVRTIYLLSKNEFVYNLAGDLAAGNVYLNPNHNSSGGGGGGGSRLFIKWDNTETGIDHFRLSTLTSHPSGTWYTLDGRQLNGKPTQKGLYLCNGQKTVVR